jgi:hypothetical protein
MEDIYEQNAEENIWTKRQEVISSWRKLHNEVLHLTCTLTKYWYHGVGEKCV